MVVRRAPQSCRRCKRSEMCREINFINFNDYDFNISSGVISPVVSPQTNRTTTVCFAWFCLSPHHNSSRQAVRPTNPTNSQPTNQAACWPQLMMTNKNERFRSGCWLVGDVATCVACRTLRQSVGQKCTGCRFHDIRGKKANKFSTVKCVATITNRESLPSPRMAVEDFE